MSSKDDINKINTNYRKIETNVFRLEKTCKFGSKCTKINDSKFPCQFNHHISSEWLSKENLISDRNFCNCESPSIDKLNERRCKDLNCKKDHLAGRCYWAKAKYSKIKSNGFGNKVIASKNNIKAKKSEKKKKIYDYKTVITNSLKYFYNNSKIAKLSDDEKKNIYSLMNVMTIFLNGDDLTINNELTFSELKNFFDKNIKSNSSSEIENDLMIESYLESKDKNNTKAIKSESSASSDRL